MSGGSSCLAGQCPIHLNVSASIGCDLFGFQYAQTTFGLSNSLPRKAAVTLSLLPLTGRQMHPYSEKQLVLKVIGCSSGI